MLDLDHPLTPHVFRASALIDGVMKHGQRMSVSPSDVRARLLAECLPLLAELRELAQARFSDRTEFILQAVDEYEAGVRALAGLGGGRITKDQCDGAANCPVCATAITRIARYHLVLCGECDRLFTPAKAKLESFEGFGTDAI